MKRPSDVDILLEAMKVFSFSWLCFPVVCGITAIVSAPTNRLLAGFCAPVESDSKLCTMTHTSFSAGWMQIVVLSQGLRRRRKGHEKRMHDNISLCEGFLSSPESRYCNWQRQAEFWTLAGACMRTWVTPGLTGFSVPIFLLSFRLIPFALEVFDCQFLSVSPLDRTCPVRLSRSAWCNRM